MYKLAPFPESYDMWVALAFCYLPLIPFLVLGYIASKSGSYIKVQKPGAPTGVTEWVASEDNIPIYKTGYFQFAIVWLVLGSLFFWLGLWPSHHDVWFITTEK
jgi:hypothetical protein